MMRFLVVAVALAFLPPGASSADLTSQVRSWRSTHEPQIVGQLDELTRIRSIATDPAGLTEEASRLQALLRERGFETRLIPTGAGSPQLVFASLKTPGARRTVAFYAHYDGQPVTPGEWRSDPFVPVMRTGPPGPDIRDVDWRSSKPPFDPEWRLYGRAASDDKASIVAFLAAFDALKAAGRRPSVNIKVLWEGEEEAGSPHLAAALAQNQADMAADLWLIGDAPVHPSRRRMLYFGARGTLGLEAKVYGPLHAVHDGHYGNWAPNPAVMAAELIAQMRDSDGAILIPGFGDDVRPLTPAELQAIAALPPVETELKRSFGMGRSEGAEGLTASTMRPALNIRGIRSGQVGAQAANAIPPDATISIDFRLVPGQTPGGVRSKLEAWLRSKGWTIVDRDPDFAMRLASPRIVRLDWDPGYPALRTDMTSPTSRAVIATANRAAGGPVALLPMMGASVPIYIFADTFKAPVIGLPIVNHDNNQHAADENMRLQNLGDGIETYAGMMADLSW